MSNPELNPGGKVRVALTLALNLEELQEQKARLESLVETQAYPVFEGLVALLARIQDQADFNWICVTDDPDTWPPIGVIVLAKSDDPHFSVQLLCVENLDKDWPATHISWKVPHNVYEDSSDIISYECSSSYPGPVSHWRPI